MITKDEIVTRSEELSVHTSNIQRDYVFGWILSGIYSQSDLGNEIVLKGGNCFRKAYFERTRYSPDLDFVTLSKVDSASLAVKLNKVCEFASQSTGVTFDTSRTRVDEKGSADRDKNIQKVRLYFKDFFGEENELTLAVRLDISQLGRIHLPVQSRHLIHQYSDAPQLDVSIRCLKLEELLAAKLKCLLQRQHSADLYDFVNAMLIGPKIELDRAQLIQTFLKMTIFGSGPGIVRDLLVNLPFQILRQLWEQYVLCPRNALIEFDHAVTSFISVIDELFGGLPRRSGEFAYFPAEMRNPIMQAGRDLTVLRVVYDGVPRQVEPYSLAYKVRQDGIGREYFYVYDRTGGRSSGPGLKSFVHPNISALENTDLKFEPTCEVELSRAGEFFGDRVFHGNPKSPFLSSPFAAVYTIQCPICRKRFRRKIYSTRLNAHKDSYGNKCFGTMGQIV